MHLNYYLYHLNRSLNFLLGHLEMHHHYQVHHHYLSLWVLFDT